MRFLPGSLFLSLFLLLAQGIAVPVADAEPEAAPEDWELTAKRALPTFPGLPGPSSSTSCNQTNQCQTGISYCCNTENGQNNCVKSATNCQQTVICCNNNFGFQFCFGNIDFNVPITINVNIPK